MSDDLASAPPVLPLGVEQAFAPPDGGTAAAGTYQPAVYAVATVRFVDSKRGVDHSERVACLVPFAEGVADLDWSAGRSTVLDLTDLEAEPRDRMRFAPLPAIAASAKTYSGAAKDFARRLAASETCSLLTCPALDATSEPAEDERAFRVRLQQRARERRDGEKDALERKYATKLASLEDKRRRAEDAQQRETEHASQHKLQTAVSFGATVLGAILGGRLSSVGRATTAARALGRTMKENQDVERASAKVDRLSEQYADLEAQLRDEVAVLEGRWDVAALTLEPLEVKPRKSDVAVRKALLVWVAGA